MREQLRERTVESHGELSSAHFGINTADQAHIIGILRNRLYSDKIMTVLREYGTNAWDAHVEGGIGDKPVKVTLPSRFAPTLRVRDYGPGIVEEDIFNVYCRYGNSTKRNTNTAVGMLGIGCKSGFAYSDAFTVVSYHGGMKKTYTAFIDPTNLGQMTKLAEQECGDETGIEIQIPVQMSDVPAFISKAQQLFKYFNPRPEINCNLPTRGYTTQGTGWALRSGENSDTDRGPVAVMGNIGYPIKTERLDKLPDRLKGMLNTNIDMLFPIGAVSIAASREDLEYTEKTVNAIKTCLEMCLRELEVNLKKSLDEAKTLHEARKIFNRATADGQYTWNHRHGRQTNLAWTVAMARKHWKSPVTGVTHDLSERHFKPLRDGTEMEVRALMHGSDSTVGVGTRRYTVFDHGQNTVIALCDVKSQWVGRADNLRQELQEKESDAYNIMIVKFRTDDQKAAKAAYDKWMKDCSLEGTPVFKLSDYEGKSMGSNASTGPRTRNKKTLKKVFKLKADSFQPGASAPSDNYEVHAADLEDGDGIWMEIHAFRPVGSSVAALNRRLQNLKAIGVDLSKLVVVGVKPKEKAKVGDDWTTFEDWYNEKLEEFVKNNPNTMQLLKIQAVEQYVHKEARFNYRNRGNSLVNAGLPKTHALVRHFHEVWEILNQGGKISDAERTKRQIIYDAISRLPDDKRPKVSYNVHEKQSAITRAYPMLEYSQVFNIGYWGGYYNQNQNTAGAMNITEAKKIAQYVRLVDES